MKLLINKQEVIDALKSAKFFIESTDEGWNTKTYEKILNVLGKLDAE